MVPFHRAEMGTLWGSGQRGGVERSASTWSCTHGAVFWVGFLSASLLVLQTGSGGVPVCRLQEDTSEEWGCRWELWGAIRIRHCQSIPHQSSPVRAAPSEHPFRSAVPWPTFVCLGPSHPVVPLQTAGDTGIFVSDVWHLSAACILPGMCHGCRGDGWDVLNRRERW